MWREPRWQAQPRGVVFEQWFSGRDNFPEWRAQTRNRRFQRLDSENGRAGDLLGGGQIFLHQHRRERENVTDVVEPVARIILWEIISRTKVDAQQIRSEERRVGKARKTRHE